MEYILINVRLQLISTHLPRIGPSRPTSRVVDIAMLTQAGDGAPCLAGCFAARNSKEFCVMGCTLTYTSVYLYLSALVTNKCTSGLRETAKRLCFCYFVCTFSRHLNKWLNLNFFVGIRRYQQLSLPFSLSNSFKFVSVILRDD